MTVSPGQIRADFSAAMSEMYRTEVPAYGTLVRIVEQVNAGVLDRDDNALALTPGEDTNRISAERHGAIRLGTAEELAMMGRVFAVMGMEPIGYYDLSVASVPVHSTAFRPIGREALAENPFRVFTSLLRLELIQDEVLRDKAAATLARRCIFTDDAIRLTEKAEAEGGLGAEDASRFVTEVLETFRWHPEACVDDATFDELIAAHRLIADVVSFKGPHINHLTPRTLDIDAAQAEMLAHGLPAKAIVEGPPRRACPILLRQTAFKALNEAIRFPVDGGWQEGQHTARFGEIEQRGVALTPKGRALYDQLLADVRAEILPAADGSNAADYVAKLEDVFKAFPDTWRELHDQDLGYFKYAPGNGAVKGEGLQALLDSGALTLSPIIYEDFLPVSAAGIFQSNLGDEARTDSQAASSRSSFEAALGKRVIDEFALYEAMQAASYTAALEQVNKGAA
ncbi:putative glyoxalase superfamily metalloenzyme YdcJ [Roseibium hamelinense]|uniref:2-oxoadipate dioxygenase/decarboxylase n=1 Tax=Roseibium hamelinense TaxID=150831 RepID=A0A562TGQ2_9HYPH|nr:VOC family protein [Roseibium hamelinense]MTI42463.1 VOC family protein [Roseibium hamelinense]TWI92493.1 putative glyoxalase superfamily metalloenzyme YdcJ [Roseibium hamelinense]